MPSVQQQFIVPVQVTVRACREEDLPLLEWFGLFTAHREIIRSAFDAQERREGIIMVADVTASQSPRCGLTSLRSAPSQLQFFGLTCTPVPSKLRDWQPSHTRHRTSVNPTRFRVRGTRGREEQSGSPASLRASGLAHGWRRV